jgi:hypothetical protein
MAFIHPDQVQSSFASLASTKTQGKTHSERTSVILYFLAFDATCKRVGSSSLDFDYDKSEGINNRTYMETEFARLCLVDSHEGGTFQISELGKVSLERKSPTTRISSNFFTVPLKKASTQKDISSYPKRPPAPVLNLGKTSELTNWGITYHPSWKVSLPKLFSEVKGSTYFTDLAICVFRDSEIEKGDIREGLELLIAERFSKEVVDYWIDKIRKEKLFWRPTSPNLFSDCYRNALLNMALASANPYEVFTKKQLIERILVLESEVERFNAVSPLQKK